MQIRPFRNEDATALGRIFHRAVQATPEGEYSADQRQAWSAGPIPAERYLARIQAGDHQVYVAVDTNDHPTGFVELQPDGHIDCFYRDPEHAGSGVGTALYDHLEDQARRQGITRLWVEASDAAKRFFLRQGFGVLERREIARNGVTLHNWAMEKHLR